MQPLLILLALGFIIGLTCRKPSFWQLAVLALASVATATALYVRTGFM